MTDLVITLFNLSFSAGVLIAALLIARPLLKKLPRWVSCSLWGLVGLRLILPFSPESIFSLLPTDRVIPADIAVRRSPSVNTGIDAVNRTVNPILQDSFTPDPTGSVNPMQVLLSVGGYIWLLGVLLLLGYAVISYQRLRRSVSASVKVEKGVFLCDGLRSPFILGVLFPRIYLPSGLAEADRVCVLQHERAHLVRRDHWWKAVGYLLLTVYWFNPLVWAGYWLLSRDIETACDERVIRNASPEEKAHYSETLLRLARPGRGIAACPLAFGEGRVKGRIKSVLSYKKPAFWVLILSFVLLIAVGVCFLTAPSDGIKAEGMLAVALDIAVTEHHEGNVTAEDAFIATDYRIAGIEKGEDTTTVYAWVQFNAYVYGGSYPDLDYAFRYPAAIVFAHDGDGENYRLSSYTAPEREDSFRDFITSVFPAKYSSKALKTESLSAEQNDACRKAAEDYYTVAQGVPTDEKAVASAIRSASAARLTASGGESLLVTGEVDSLKTFLSLSIHPVDMLPADASGDWLYRVEFDPVDMVSGGRPVKISFHKDHIRVNNLIYVADDGVDYHDVPAWIEEKISYFSASVRYLTLDEVIAFSEKGQALEWSDFDPYECTEIGSGLYILLYPIDEDFELMIGGGVTVDDQGLPHGADPMYFYLKSKTTDEFIDIREGGVEAFIAAHRAK